MKDAGIIEVSRERDLARLRRLALSAQGLLQARPYGNGRTGARNAIAHLGYVQIDTISVVERAHHHVLHSRVPGFEPAMLDRMLLDRDIFEYWAHAAAFLPMADFRFSLPYKQALKNGRTHWYRNPDRKLMRELLARIRAEGPLRSRDLESPARKGTGWWDWKPAKKALEQLYMEGELMVSKRDGFQKTYDLSERVLPSDVDTRMPDIDAFAAHLVEQQLRCHGPVSLKGLTYLRRDTGLRGAVKKLVDERLARGSLQQFRIGDGEVFLLESGAFEQPLPRLDGRLRILSPFDNSVIQRERLSALFGYDYQIECYVPAAKRRYGYFCLPLLYRGEFVGRMDCKAHRAERRLEIRALHFERHGFDQRELDAALVEALERFRDFQLCDSVSLNSVFPASLARPLRRALAG